SIVNLWLYGTTFTTLPRASKREISALHDRDAVEDLLIRRLDDLVAGLAAPGANERLRFARQVVERQGIDPGMPAGREKAREYLVQARERMIADTARHDRAARAANLLNDRDAKLTAFATLYQDRGLSSDTSLAADFAIDHALAELLARGRLP